MHVIYATNEKHKKTCDVTQTCGATRKTRHTSCFISVKNETNMASGQNVPELGGYDYEFTGKVPDNCECLVCHLPMKDPVQIVGCGHRLCNICMESLLR